VILADWVNSVIAVPRRVVGSIPSLVGSERRSNLAATGAMCGPKEQNPNGYIFFCEHSLRLYQKCQSTITFPYQDI